MSHLKKSGLIAASIFLLFFTACGGGSNGGNNPAPQPRPAVTISIAQSLTVRVGESKTLNVTRQNTDDFTVSASPASGSGCTRTDANTVRCAPTAAGTYTVTVTATADTSRTSSSTVTVPDLEIFDGAEQTLYADETEGVEISFNAPGDWTATATDDGTGNPPTWLTLSIAASASSLNDVFTAALQATGDTTINGLAGNNTIILTLQPNDSGEGRTATITISTANKQIEVTITQLYYTEDEDPYIVSISIAPATLNVRVGESKTFTVTRQNTDDFTLSVAPTSGSGCVKSTNTVTCTPMAAGTYNVTVTATTDTTKTATATLTASESGELGEPGLPYVLAEKVAVKYIVTRGDTVSHIQINAGDRFDGWDYRLHRVEVLSEDGLTVNFVGILDHDVKKAWSWIAHMGWQEDGYDEDEIVEVQHQALPDKDKEILGMQSHAYLIIAYSSGGSSTTTTAWIGNGFLLASEVKIEKNGNVVSVTKVEAINIAYEVPSEAFTQTLDINWNWAM